MQYNATFSVCLHLQQLTNEEPLKVLLFSAGFERFSRETR